MAVIAWIRIFDVKIMGRKAELSSEQNEMASFDFSMLWFPQLVSYLLPLLKRKRKTIRPRNCSNLLKGGSKFYVLHTTGFTPKKNHLRNHFLPELKMVTE